MPRLRPRRDREQVEHLHGFHLAGPPDFSGHDRWTIETEDDVVVEFEEKHALGIKQVGLSCGYCEGHYRARTLDGALRWWRSHDCPTLEVAEASAIVYDLTDRLAA